MGWLTRSSFTLYGPSHLLALLVVGAALVGIVRELRQLDPERLAPKLRPWLTALLLFQGIYHVAVAVQPGSDRPIRNITGQHS